MDKMTLLMELRSVQKTLNASIDSMMEKVMAMDDTPAPVSEAVGGRADGVFNAKMSMSYLGVSSTKFYEGIRQGVIPPGNDSLGPRSKRWRQSELDACLAARRKEEKNDSTKKAGRTARSTAPAR